jgi:hypothetical protein
MGFWATLLGIEGSKKSSGGIRFRGVDWLAIEGKLRTIELLANQKDQTSAKQVIIQADMMIDSILKQANVPGQTMGERMKAINSLLSRDVSNKLWQAHKKRNELVHEDGSFVADWEKQTYLSSFKEAVSAMRGLK